jgi:hypothetical protein
VLILSINLGGTLWSIEFELVATVIEFDFFHPVKLRRAETVGESYRRMRKINPVKLRRAETVGESYRRMGSPTAG